MRYFSSLVHQTLSRSKESTLSILGITNPGLREHLGQQMESECGEEGSFLAPPLFEHTFGWEPAEPKIEDLRGNLLSKSVVDALDSKENGRYRFSAHFKPFKHQLKSWETLLDKERKSVVVTSGTGSGKTECFMVPVLEDLYQELTQKQEKLVGVRAIFLYPLNALINSQRERLSAWTQNFGDGMRFCLYNGNTVDKENQKTSEQKKTPNEILTRQLMRREPAPILVTNGTMLEYMLVRNIDAPIVEISKKEKSLRWIILDEAHTYVGSQAAELSMQLRRVLHAFGVEAKNVRFVATSATIADENAEEELQKYLSELAGVDISQVVVIGGNRKVPTITDLENEQVSLDELIKIPADKPNKAKDFDVDVSKIRFEALCKSSLAKTIRGILTESKTPLTIEKITTEVFKKTDCKLSQDEILRWIDLLTGTKPDINSEAFLRVRAHFFQSMLNGLWSCIDKNCSAKKETLLKDNWPFGNVYVKHKHKCECGAPVLELAHCNDCNEPHLLGLDKNGILSQRNLDTDDDFSLNQEFHGDDSENDEEELDVRSSKHSIVIASRGINKEKYNDVGINKETSRIGGFNEDINLLVDESNETECGHCSYKGFNKSSPLRRAMLGSPFYVSNAVPTLLEYCPDAGFDKQTNIGPESLPGRGRKLITFTDSRQGTARMAVRMQQEAERNKLRGLVFEILKNEQLKQGPSINVEGVDEAKLKELRATAETLRNIMPKQAAEIDKNIEEILAVKEGGSLFNAASLNWTEMVTELAQHSDVHSSILQYNQYANPELFSGNTGAHTLADMLLVREFARRPKRQNSLETQGIVKISYQGIDKITDTPPLWENNGLDLNDWRDFIKVCLDFYVRENTFIQLEDNLRAWIGFKFSPKKLMKPDPTGISTSDNRVKRWPQVKKNIANRLGKLLALGGNLKLDDQTDVDIINDWLLSVWNAITSKANPILKSEGNQYYLIRNNLTLSFIDKGYLCPVTNKILDTTFKGLTPYLPRDISKGNFQCEEVSYPSIWNFDVSQEEYQEGLVKVREQLKLDENITNLRRRNVWTDINDRTVEGGFYYRTAEHSAQQSAERLQTYEAMFKKGTVNVLNCSTTMEMGVDIGGISAVVMNNVPPHPANYLQRAGRAGRSKESRAISYTLCKSNPHDTQVFNNPAWPFVTKIPAPQISLNSERLVQRHVNSLLLSIYLKEVIGNTQKEKTSLNLQWFYEDETQSTCVRFKGWLGQQTPEQKQHVKSLVKGTALDAMQVGYIIDRTSKAIEKLESDWIYTFKRLIAQLEKAGKDSPFEFRIKQELARHRKEYLLKELAAKTFLPGYGFPTDVVSLNNFNLTDYKRDKDKEANNKFGREDNISHLRGMPTRNLSVAIREYAPGAELVIDGRVFKSSGISLNWQKLGVPNAREEQKFDTAWRCSNCGDSGLSIGVANSDDLKCHSCEEEIKPQFQLKVLEPTGFVTDFFDEPSNDISTQKYIPVQPAWVSVTGDSHPLPNPETGFMCYGNSGTIFHHSSGEHGRGYAVCLTCGRAESMISDDEFPKGLTPTVPHRPVISMPSTKGSEKVKEQCEGSSIIQSGIHLGCSSLTDVFEITLRNPEKNIYIPDSPEGRTVATTLAVALRNALSEKLGVSTSEMGYTIRPSKISGSGNSAMVIQIYDIISGGAGFSTTAPHYISELLKNAYDSLYCSEQCDDVCSTCLLDSSTRHDSLYLNRNIAIAWLGLKFKDEISLPEKYQYFSGAQYCHASVKEVIAQQINNGAKNVTLWMGNDTNEWDLNSRRVRTLVHQYISIQDINLTFVLPNIEVDDETKNELLRYKSWGVALVNCHKQCSNDGVLVAQIISDKEIVSIAASSTELISVNHHWLLSTPEIVVVKSKDYEMVDLLPIDTKDWVKLEASLVSELELSSELNGKITDFGKRFWQSAMDSNEGLAKAIQSSKVKKVLYSDRYLQSPWYLIMIGEVLNALPTHEYSTVQIDTVFNEKARNSGYINNDWQHIDDMKELYSLWFKLGLNVDLTLNLHSNRFEIPHRRLMIIEFDNGEVFKIKSDQGVGYWSLHVPDKGHYLKFLDFDLIAEEQCAKIFEVREKCLVRNSANWVTDFVISKD
jgi:DEAD/DEAH box helicase domain-containing protein